MSNPDSSGTNCKSRFRLIVALNLFNSPLNKEILVDGLIDHDPNIPTNSITWQYAIVRKDFVSPVINTDILSELVVVEYNSHWVKEAYRLVGVEYEGVPYGHYLSGKPTVLPPSAQEIIPLPPDCPEGFEAKLVPIDFPLPPGHLQWNGFVFTQKMAVVLLP